MALSDFTSLKASIADWLHRSDVTAAASIASDVISLCEADINATIRVRQMEDVTTQAITSGYLVHPSDWIAWKSISRSTGGKRFNLSPYSSEGGAQRLGPLSGVDAGYEVLGDRTYVLPSGTGSYECRYYKKVPALTTSATTNWLLTNYPGIYLYGSLLQATAWEQSDPRIPLWKQAYDEAVRKLTTQDSQAKYGPVPVMRPEGVR